MRHQLVQRLAIAFGMAAILGLALNLVPGAPLETPSVHAATLAQPAQGGGGRNVSGPIVGPQGGNRGPQNSGQFNSGVGRGLGISQQDLGIGHHLQHVPSTLRFYNGAFFDYGYDWYFSRHVSFPWLYQVYEYEPVAVCFSEYYFFEGAFYCFIG